jgi:hypothetical protein
MHWLLLIPSVHEHVEGMGNGFSISDVMTPQAKKMDKDQGLVWNPSHLISHQEQSLERTSVLI